MDTVPEFVQSPEGPQNKGPFACLRRRLPHDTRIIRFVRGQGGVCSGAHTVVGQSVQELMMLVSIVQEARRAEGVVLDLIVLSDDLKTPEACLGACCQRPGKTARRRPRTDLVVDGGLGTPNSSRQAQSVTTSPCNNCAGKVPDSCTANLNNLIIVHHSLNPPRDSHPR